jgi:hypothetical protein
MHSLIADLSSLYTPELNFGQTIWDKLKVLLGTSSGATEELGEPQRNMMKTCWEHNGNKEEKQKATPPAPPTKGKTGPIMSAC